MINYRFLEQKMKEQHITYRRLSELLNFKSPNTVWKWLHRRTQMKAIYLERLAAIFDVPLQSLFIFDEPAPQTPCNGGECDEV